MTSTRSAHEAIHHRVRGSHLESYLDALRGARVTLLCDVKEGTPVSRKPGFSKRKLAESCEGAGIRYVHLPRSAGWHSGGRQPKPRRTMKRLLADYVREDRAAGRRARDNSAASCKPGQRVALTLLRTGA